MEAKKEQKYINNINIQKRENIPALAQIKKKHVMLQNN